MLSIVASRSHCVPVVPEDVPPCNCTVAVVPEEKVPVTMKCLYGAPRNTGVPSVLPVVKLPKDQPVVLATCRLGIVHQFYHPIHRTIGQRRLDQGFLNDPFAGSRTFSFGLRRWSVGTPIVAR